MNNLKMIREQKGYTQLNLGMQIGVQQETISAYENGKAMPTAETLLKLAEYFGCSTDFLLDLTEVKNPVNSLIVDNLSVEEAGLVADYRSLNKDNKNKVIGYIKALL